MDSENWFTIGHTTRIEEQSGCTAIVFDRMVPAAVDVRGGAPGTHETTLLDQGSIAMLDAILLSGGSAFGLRATEGVMNHLVEQGRGVKTRAGTVPLVASAIIFDLATGPTYIPTVEDAYAAATSAGHGPWDSGQIGAGTGATVAKIGGRPSPGGCGIASVRAGGFAVTAVVVLNAVGDVRHPASGEWLARDEAHSGREIAMRVATEASELENTTIGAILVSGGLDRRTLTRCCVSAQAALARCTIPAHTILDGDTFFAAASELGSPGVQDTLAITSATEVAVEDAIVAIFQTRSET